MNQPNSTSLTTFVACAQEDDGFRRELEQHLKNLRRKGLEFSLFHRRISTGQNWSHAIENNMGLAQLVILMLSDRFLASGYVNGVEVARAIQRHEQGHARVIPVVLRNCDWTGTPIGRLEALPPDGRPVAEWGDQNSAIVEIAEGIRCAAERLLAAKDAEETRILATKVEPTEKREESSTDSQPTHIGRYAVRKLLGAGAFGSVFLAYDENLDRLVAIKTPRADRIAKPEDVGAYLKEARTVAKLEHPNIVPVYDFGRTEFGRCYLVSKWIDGSNLAEKTKKSRYDIHKAVNLVATIADALAYAHQNYVYHRDIKPANILIDKMGVAYLADFGLALRDEDYGKSSRVAGTPAYMSPEQARKEGHRVDGRSDIFSLGVVFYELLCGRRPFRSQSTPALMKEIANDEVRPPRQLDGSIHKELERICLKALANRISDRYTNAGDLADDLKLFLESPPSESSTRSGSTVRASSRSKAQARDSSRSRKAEESSTRKSGTHGGVGSTTIPLHREKDSTVRISDTADPLDTPKSKINPKGLLSFDESDRDVFLELIPGPRDRNNVPESIRLWKRRIEQTSPDRTFRVGLIYGPSGCGKTSLIRAGLIPHLSSSVVVVDVDASARSLCRGELLRKLRSVGGELTKGQELPDIVSAIRRGHLVPREKKVLIFIDQLEQWLHEPEKEDSALLLNALRQCDGGRIQCLLSVRVDYLMGIHRFMRDLDIRIHEGRNSFPIDLFDPFHARKVLMEFGWALDRLPEAPDDYTSEQNAFVEQAVSGLEQNGKIMPAQLAMFVQMVRGHSWSSATMEKLGGTKGIGVKFLQETIDGDSAPLALRGDNSLAAQRVLEALLPEMDVNIKGNRKSYAGLLQASGLTNRPHDFDGLLLALNRELRFITPADPVGDAAGAEQPAHSKHYQLAHDYLIPVLREWLSQKLKETRSGRARVQLREVSALWNEHPENRRLPTLWEYVNVRRYVSPGMWNEAEERVMQAARRYHLIRIGTAVLLIGFFVYGLMLAQSWSRGRVTANRLASTESAKLPDVFQEIEALGYVGAAAFTRRVDELAQDEMTWQTAILRYATAPTDNALKKIFQCASDHDSEPNAAYTIGDFLAGNRDDLDARALKQNVEDLWSTALSPLEFSRNHLREATLLAKLDENDQRWAMAGSDTGDNLVTRSFADRVASWLVTESPDVVVQWAENLGKADQWLIGSIEAILKDSNRSDTERSLAARILAVRLDKRNDLKRLVSLLPAAQSDQFGIVLRPVQARVKEALPMLQEMLSSSIEHAETEAKMEIVALKIAKAALALILLDRSEGVWDLLKYGPDSRVRSCLIHSMRSHRVDASYVLQRLLEETDAGVIRALLLALGEYDPSELRADRHDICRQKLVDWYRNDIDPGVRSCAQWVLRRWNWPLPESRRRDDSRGGWYTTDQGLTMVIVSNPLPYLMGSPPSEKGRETGNYEDQRQVKIPRSFAISTNEVTVGQFLGFRPEFKSKYEHDVSPTPDSPINSVTWFMAAAYCNWLSKQEGIPEDQWCYPKLDPLEAERRGLLLAKDHLTRTGYRLPTEAEWENACRAGTETSRFFGQSEQYLHLYAVTVDDHSFPVGTLRPNALGLFDVYGNLVEWTQTRFDKQLDEDAKGVVHDVEDQRLFVEGLKSGDDPFVGFTGQDYRVCRGGAYHFPHDFVRSADRGQRFHPWLANPQVGFRVARTMPGDSRPN